MPRNTEAITVNTHRVQTTAIMETENNTAHSHTKLDKSTFFSHIHCTRHFFCGGEITLSLGGRSRGVVRSVTIVADGSVELMVLL